MIKDIWVLAKDRNIKKAIQGFFPEAFFSENPKKVKNLKGIIFVSIKDFGIIPFNAEKGLFPIAIIDKKSSNIHFASLVMRIMSENYFDYIEFPFEEEQLRSIVDKIYLKDKDENQIIYIKDKDENKTVLCQHLCSIVGSSESLRNICRLAGEVAPTDLPVLITGESGTGKELLARGIWRLSKRKDKPFIAINCAALPETLLESELFGYEKGAFTGAEKQKKGKFEIADGGTIFLDEVGELSLSAQSKLLRVLQENSFYRVGGEEEVKVDVRVIAATNRNLEEMINEGKFREDLYYRLNVIHINLPPLRERKEDIPYIVECIINKNKKKLNKDIIGFSKEYIKILKEQKWEGNIRQLENVVIRSMILCRDNVLTVNDLAFIEEKRKDYSENIPEDNSLYQVLEKYIKIYIENENLPILNEEIEKFILEKVLKHTKYNLSKSAEILGINRATLRKKLQKYNMYSDIK